MRRVDLLAPRGNPHSGALFLFCTSFCPPFCRLCRCRGDLPAQFVTESTFRNELSGTRATVSLLGSLPGFTHASVMLVAQPIQAGGSVSEKPTPQWRPIRDLPIVASILDSMLHDDEGHYRTFLECR